MDDETVSGIEAVKVREKIETAKVGDLVLICLGDNTEKSWMEEDKLDGSLIGEFNGRGNLKLISGEELGIRIKSPAHSLRRLKIGSIEIPDLTDIITNGIDLTKGMYADSAVALTRIRGFYVGAEEIGKRLRRDDFYRGLAGYFTGKS